MIVGGFIFVVDMLGEGDFFFDGEEWSFFDFL